MRLASTPGLASMALRTAAIPPCSPAAQTNPAPGGSARASTAAGSASTHCRSSRAALILGAGSLAMLFFGWDVLLTVAVEIAFSVATARAAVGVEREGWLSAAVRLTWKPLLGALVCAVVLGATIDHFLPGVQSLPQALRLIQAAL
jgi:hypothetical protein